MAKEFMKAAVLSAEWKPRGPVGPRDVKDKRAQEGGEIWLNPKVEVVERLVPQIGPTEILIKVKVCGICGSDVLMNWPDEDGYTHYPYIMSNEVVIGHEFSGEIVEVGQLVKELQKETGRESFKVGSPVTAQCVINCGFCEMCKEGRFDSCQLNEELGFSVDGAMAEYVKAEVRHVYSLEDLKETYRGEDVFFAGALVEPLAGVYKAIISVGGGINPGDNAVVIGGGPIGLAAVSLLKAMGAAKVILSEPSTKRREIGEAMGATHSLDPTKMDLREGVLKATNGVGAKIYFEAAGVAPKIWPEIDHLFRSGEAEGKLVLMGHGPGYMEVSHETLIGGYGSLVGSHGHSGVWRNVIRMVGAGLIDPRKMITKRIALAEVPKWLETLRTNKEESKVVVRF